MEIAWHELDSHDCVVHVQKYKVSWKENKKGLFWSFFLKKSHSIPQFESIEFPSTATNTIAETNSIQ